MEQCNDNGNVAYLSRDELKDAVLLWRRIEKSRGRRRRTGRGRAGSSARAALSCVVGTLQGGGS